MVLVEPQIPTSGTTKVEFAYDYMGRRVQKKVFSYVTGDWQLMTDNLFLYDGWNLISESTITGQQSPVVKSYVWGLDLSQSLQGAGGIGGLIAAVDNGETYHYFYDGNGNVAQLVKASDGSIVAHYEYDPYGNIIVESGSLTKENPFSYSTKYKDSETNLLYFGYRYYSPELGRWISRDPIEEEDYRNLYAFNKDNPIDKIDFLGLLVVYLQFDDPPIGGTKTVLEALRETSTKATFFVVGKHTETISKSQLLEILADGHTIGNHSYSHMYSGKPSDFVADFQKAEKIIYNLTAKRPRLARIPGNKPEWKLDIANALRKAGWDVRGWDWEIGGAMVIPLSRQKMPGL